MAPTAKTRTNVPELAVCVVRMCFGETAVVPTRDECRKGSVVRERKQHRLENVNVAQIILAQASHAMSCGFVPQLIVRCGWTLVALREVSLRYLRWRSLCRAAARLFFPNRSW